MATWLVALLSVVVYLVAGGLVLWMALAIRTDRLYADENFWYIVLIYWLWPVLVFIVLPWWLGERFGLTNRPRGN